MSFTSKTGLDGFLRRVRGTSRTPGRVTQWHSGSRRRLVSFCFASGHPATPRHPIGGNPPAAKSPETSAADERASQHGIRSPPPLHANPVFARGKPLIRFIRVQGTSFGWQPLVQRSSQRLVNFSALPGSGLTPTPLRQDTLQS